MTRLGHIGRDPYFVKRNLRLFARRLLLLCIGILTAAIVSRPASAATFSLMVSKFADRSSPTALSGQALSGNVYVFAVPYTGISRIEFYLDDPTMSGSPRQVERRVPYDFAGTVNAATASPLDTTQLAAGSHTITAKVVQEVGGAVTIQNTFTIGSGTGASSVTLSWVAPSTRTDGNAFSLSELAGYRIYHGSDANQLRLLVNLNEPTATTYTVSSLLAGAHYFAITAYDVSGMESQKSKVLSKSIR